MLILAMDSSSAACSVAISRDGTVIGGEFSLLTRGHAAMLPPMIERVLTTCGMTARDMDAFAVSVGPGSFTGLRVAMAAAKGLAVVVDRPLLGISCFDAVARRARSEIGGRPFDALLLALASKREEVFVQALNSAGREIISGQVIGPVEIDLRIGALLGDNALLYIAGDATDTVTGVLQAPNAHCRAQILIGPAMPPDAADIALVAHDISTREVSDSHSYSSGLAPLYPPIPQMEPHIDDMMA